MPTSVRERALDAFLGVFAGLTRYRLNKRLAATYRLDEAGDLPALIVLPGPDEVINRYGGGMLIGVTVVVLAVVRAASDEALAAELDRAWAEVFGAVGAAMRADSTLGNLIREAEYDGSEPLVLTEAGAPPQFGVALAFVVKFDQSDTDPNSSVPYF